MDSLYRYKENFSKAYIIMTVVCLDEEKNMNKKRISAIPCDLDEQTKLLKIVQWLPPAKSTNSFEGHMDTFKVTVMTNSTITK